MTYLLDVNALVAWGHGRSPHHGAFHRWLGTVGLPQVATCAHVELGFLRISMQVFGLSAAAAQQLLGKIKGQAGGFVPAAPSPLLPPWGTSGARTSDAYLMQVAASAGLSLATFDTGIPGATLIGP